MLPEEFDPQAHHNAQMAAYRYYQSIVAPVQPVEAPVWKLTETDIVFLRVQRIDPEVEVT